MTSYEKKKSKKTQIGISWLRKEYSTTEGEFNRSKYEKALKNFSENLEKLKICPLPDFLRLGVEHIDKLSQEGKDVIKKIKDRCYGEHELLK